MKRFFQLDWQSLFVPTHSVLEMFLRGTFMYLGMFVLLRLFRRQAGAVGTADLLVIVVIADAAQNGMVGEAKSITEAMLLIGTIILWDHVLDFLAHRSEFFQRLIEPKDLLLISDGKLVRQNLQKEMISYDELLSHLRQKGVASISEVKECRLESNGHFSVIKAEKEQG